MNKIKAAVIGVGSISQEHINGYINNPDVELYAFCDINEARLYEKAENKLSIIEELFNGLTEYNNLTNYNNNKRFNLKMN